MTRYMGIKEFREAGYLQEVNRRLLHPLGLALEADVEGDVLRVWDYRDDPEGIVYQLDAEYAETAAEHIATFQEEWDAKATTRQERLGWVEQPLEDVARERE